MTKLKMSKNHGVNLCFLKLFGIIPFYIVYINKVVY